jgi:hypothetical protein
MRTLLAVHEWAWWLMAFGSAALTFCDAGQTQEGLDARR